jgi:outer membrane protein assembly factor BamB
MSKWPGVSGRIVLLLAAVGMLSGTGRSEKESFDWPQWRGPESNGVSAETRWNPEALARGPKIRWSADVGLGHSSVVIAGGRLYAFGQKSRDSILWCLDASSGKQIWSYVYSAGAGGRYPQSTPAVDEGSVFALTHGGTVFCVDASNGELRWQRDLVKEGVASRMKYGYATSPIVEGDLLLLSLSRSRMALDKSTGETSWASEPHSGAIREGYYSSPVVYEREGRRYALMFSGTALYSVEVRTGNPQWHYDWPHFSAADPVLIGDRLFLSTDTLYPRTVLLDIAADEPVLVWQNQNMRNQFSTCVHVAGYLYGCDGDAGARPVFRCIEAATGEVMWEKSMSMASLISASGKLLILDEDGNLRVVEANPESYVELSSCQLPFEVGLPQWWAAPVLCNGRVYCRNYAGDLVCVDVRG